MESLLLGSLHNIVYTVGRLTPNGVSLLGTCFLLHKDGLFCTAGHVTSNDDRNLVIIQSNHGDLLTYQDTSVTQVQYINAQIYAIDPIKDICILRILNPIRANILIGSADDVKIGDELCIAGFPHCTEGRKVLTYQQTIVGAKILIESSSIKSKHLVVNIQARPGQSGSPILRKSDGKVVAMILGSYAPGGGGAISLAGVDPVTLHQTTHAISSEYIHDMV